MKPQTAWTRFAGAAAVAADTAILDALFVSFSYVENQAFQSPGLPLWLLCALGCYAVNLLFLRRPRALPALAVLNLGLFAATLLILLRFSAILGGPVSAVFFVGFAAITLGRGLYFAFAPVGLGAHLIHGDILSLALFWLALSAEAALLERPWYLALQLGVLLLNLLCAVALRVGGTQNGQVLVGAPAAGAFLSAGLLGGMLLLLYALAHLLAGHSRSAVQTAADGLSAALHALWDAVNSFFAWLFSLFPSPQEVPAEPPDLLPPDGISPEITVQGPADLRPLYLLGGLLLAALLLGAAALLFRFRHSRSSLSAGGTASRSSVRRSRKKGALRRRLSAWRFRLHFRLLAFRRRNTPPGVLVWLERRMKRAGAPRLSGETPRAFLSRLPMDFSALADALDRLYYGDGDAVLPPAVCRALRREAAELLPRRPSKSSAQAAAKP